MYVLAILVIDLHVDLQQRNLAAVFSKQQSCKSRLTKSSKKYANYISVYNRNPDFFNPGFLHPPNNSN